MSYMKTVSGLLFTLLLMLAPLAAAASEPTVEFDTLSHDFGNIKATGGPVSCEYKFTNTGTTPLVIVSVTNGGCGCTTPSFPKAPVAPGKTGKIKITFNPVGRKGEFNREVKVRTNGNPKRIALKFSGVVLP
ncbi:DUF1573 domain-containing protein [Muribaculaceae bacterium Isolate-104 (HZI)]|jgi:hypothetical protein|nr:DUF1573 domain-containing protein [Muribaculaceae bacterium Isolate-104 (HZI)]